MPVLEIDVITIPWWRVRLARLMDRFAYDLLEIDTRLRAEDNRRR